MYFEYLFIQEDQASYIKDNGFVSWWYTDNFLGDSSRVWPKTGLQILAKSFYDRICLMRSTDY